jgi:hypothetical protein
MERRHEQHLPLAKMRRLFDGGVDEQIIDVYLEDPGDLAV